MRTLDVLPSRLRSVLPLHIDLPTAAEQVRAQYRSMPGAFIGSTVIATLLAAMLYGRLETRVLLGWLACVYVLSCCRFLLWHGFNRGARQPEESVRWRRRAVLGAAVSGLLWGVAGVVLHVPGSLSYQLFVLLSVMALGFGSIYISTSIMQSFLAFACPAFILAALPFLRDGDTLHVAIGATVLIGLALVCRYAAGLSARFLESVQVRRQNLDLVAELRRQKATAEQANSAKSRFLAVATHELRQPLHALALFVQALRESPAAAHERQLVTNIGRSVDAMEELFDSLLDISRLDAGTVSPRVESFALASVFERVRQEYAPVAHQKGLSLAVMPTSGCIRSDPALLARIVGNLVANALSYTDAGGVVVGCRRAGSHLRIEVWDSGRGIPADKQQEIFREFAQLDPLARAGRQGLGLGLAIVERLTQLLGHTIQVRSAPGRGSVFSVTLPRAAASDRPGPPVEIHTVPDLAGALILLIDADPAVLEAMETLLGRWRCGVISARSGPEMREKLSFARRVPDLLIADYHSSAAERALAAVEMLRSEFNTDIPALLLTADSDVDVARVFELHGLPVLHKPLSPARLRTLVGNLLRPAAPEASARRAS